MSRSISVKVHGASYSGEIIADAGGFAIVFNRIRTPISIHSWGYTWEHSDVFYKNEESLFYSIIQHHLTESAHA